jgi:hypothetical protein
LDAWFNWETFIQKGDAKHEELVAGITLDYLLVNQPKWQLKIPVQNLFYHHGGQVNTDLLEPRNTYTMWHKAIGSRCQTCSDFNSITSIQNLFFAPSKHIHSARPIVYERNRSMLTELAYQLQTPHDRSRVLERS